MLDLYGPSKWLPLGGFPQVQGLWLLLLSLGTE